MFDRRDGSVLLGLVGLFAANGDAVKRRLCRAVVGFFFFFFHRDTRLLLFTRRRRRYHVLSDNGRVGLRPLLAKRNKHAVIVFSSVRREKRGKRILSDGRGHSVLTSYVKNNLSTQFTLGVSEFERIKYSSKSSLETDDIICFYFISTNDTVWFPTLSPSHHLCQLIVIAYKCLLKRGKLITAIDKAVSFVSQKSKS